MLEEFQHPQVGDTIGFGANTMRIERAEPEHQHGGTTRLISRNRFRIPTLAGRLSMLPMEPASLVMERRMLAGIRERTERLAAS